MPRVVCSIHGRVGGDLACPHIAHAFPAQPKIPFADVEVELVGGVFACGACASRLKALDDERTVDFLREFQPVCVECARAALRRQSEGEA